MLNDSTAQQHHNPDWLKNARTLVSDILQQHTGKRAVAVAPIVLIDFLDRDHNAALLLNQILYWTERTTEETGWFYKTHREWGTELCLSKYQVNRVIHGDPRVRTPKRNLTDVGLQTQVRMTPRGRVAVHYRLDMEVFIASLTEWLDQRDVDLTEDDAKSETPKSEAHAVPQFKDTLFSDYARHFRKPKARQVEQLLKALELLGTLRTREIVERCIGRGKTWNYVLKALRNEFKDGPQQHQPKDFTVPPEYNTVPIKPPTLPDPTPAVTEDVLEQWRLVFSQVNAEMPQTSRTLLKHALLLDYESDPRCLVLGVQNDQCVINLNMSFHRLFVNTAAVLFGKDIDVRFVSHKQWREQLE